MLLITKAVGWILSITPEPLIRLLCRLLGNFTYWSQPKRRVMALRNLHHSFPEKDENWRREILKEHCHRLIEMSLFVLTSPFFTPQRAKSILEEPSAEVVDIMERIRTGHPSILLLPHFTLSEAIVTLPLHCPHIKGCIATIYRPFNNEEIDQWVRHSRSRFGVELLSRKSGYSSILRYLEAGKSIGVLFDQNAGGKGSLIHFMNRVASATELPGLLARRKQAAAYILYAERTGFWRARVNAVPLDIGTHAVHVTIAAHDWLENYLASSTDRCADWLWLHDRWSTPTIPTRLFQYKKTKRNRLREEAMYRNKIDHSRVVTVWLRLPEDESKFLDLLDVLKQMRKVRPGYALCLVSCHNMSRVKSLFGSLPDEIIVLPHQFEDKKEILCNVARNYPDVWFDLEATPASLTEMKLANAQQRISFNSSDGTKGSVTHFSKPPDSNTWTSFFKQFGLKFNLED